MRQLDARGVGLLLGLLTAAALVMNTIQWAVMGHLEPMLLAPTLGLGAMLVAFPFLLGWNPFARAAQMRSCGACGTLWSPRMDRTTRCPACGGHAVPT